MVLSSTLKNIGKLTPPSQESLIQDCDLQGKKNDFLGKFSK